MRIIIIGAGPGGYETAVAAARKGVEVTIISDGPLGGTCLNEGCIPTKTFCHYAELVEQMDKAGALGIAEGSLSFDFQKVAARKREVVSQLQAGIGQLLKHKLITLVQGKASFKDAHTVVVDGEEYTGDAVIIATGSVTAMLPIPGTDLPGVVTSREILDFEEIPEKIVVIGGGVIGLEFASVFRSFGSEVTVLEYAKDILPRFDTDLAKRLKQALSKRGISIETSAQVTAIESVGGGLSVKYTKKDADLTAEAPVVLMAVGRRANTESLNLSDAGIVFDRRGVTVDENMQTNIPGVYAIGDVNGRMMLAHVATFQGMRALNHILGQTDSIDFRYVPSAVFTMPEAATVGMTEDEAKEKGLAVKCLKSMFRANGKALSMDETDGFCKLITSADDGRILGCHLFGPHSADLVQEVTVLLNKGVTIDEFKDMIHAHPTLGEVIQSAAHSL